MKAKIWIALAVPLAVLLSLALALPLGAQQPATPLKVAVINADRVLAESNIARQVQAEAEGLRADWDARISAKQQEITTKIQQGQEQRATLNDEALARLNAEIEQMRVELTRLQEDHQRAMNRLGIDAQARINAELIPAVARLAEEDGYDLILDSRIEGILYFANSLDVTDRFLALVNTNPGGPGQARQ